LYPPAHVSPRAHRHPACGRHRHRPLTQWLGSRGLLIANAVGGFGDAHAPAISAATLAAKGSVDIGLASIAVLAGFTTNAISKIVVASTVGNRRYALELSPGILLSVIAGWAGLLVA